MLMAELVLLLGLFVFLSYPLITSRFAKRMGRRPWLWFFLGMVLPLIATVLLFLLPDLSEEKK